MFNGDLGFNPFDKTHSAIGTDTQIRIRNKFLDSFGSHHIYCYNGDPRKKISSMKHTSNLTEVAIANNSKNADAYFYVNGGRKQYAIEKVRACFVDMDAGRDDSGQYLKAKEVMNIKKDFLTKINNFPVKPSWVVDTRNGYQVYWILDPNSKFVSNKTYWTAIQKKLVNYFGGDARAIKINQIYRVPFTWWRKPWEKKQAYFTSILSGSTGHSVHINDLKNALDGVSAVVDIIQTKTSDHWFEKHRKQAINSSIPEVYPHYEERQKAYGVPVPVTTDYAPMTHPVTCGGDVLNTDEQQTKLLKTVVEFLNQASTALYFSNNRFLASSAKDLAHQISDKFCIG